MIRKNYQEIVNSAPQFTVRLAETAADVRQAQALRYSVFVEELGADGYLYANTEINGESIEMVVRVDGRNHPVAGDKIALLPVEHHMHVFDAATGARLTKEAISSGS
jgi:multiple sugar transport system ATP-binding protein